MRRLYSGLLSLCILAMTCFIAFGYAALTDNLSLSGTAAAQGKPFRGVYIKSVELVSSSGVSVIENSFVHPTNHKVSADASRSGGEATYKITVHNNADVTYWYIACQYDPNYGSNKLIDASGGVTIRVKDQLSDSSQTFNSDDWIPPDTERVFYVTYSYGANAQDVCDTMVNFHFDIRLDAVHSEFVSLLNSPSYEEFKAAFEEEYATNRSKHISTETHPEVFEKFFSDLLVDIDGEQKQASVVIRRENLDGDVNSGDDYIDSTLKGCEYTLYITVEPLTPGTKPTVYAIAYSEGASGMGDNWYQIGELYEGKATVKADGSIDFANWTATEKTYEIADGISYKVGAANGDQYDIMKTLEQLISAEDQDLFNDIDNTKIFKKTYDIIQKHRDSTDPAVEGLRVAFEEASMFYNNLNNGQEFKVVRGKYTRAEIIHALKKIQAALDYYYQAYPQ